ncbi:hypothetical protein ACQR1V_13410 [Bradyrhizobium oligotrophicum]|uniref:hypothetical protein n=1 Tax=Bradyrhizobium oligotrophicum TaxID=44255 RepID=UPI003EBC0895
MTFRITHYITLSPNRNGLLYPVYSQAPSNIPLVHQVDEGYRISSFVEAYDLENFHATPSINCKEYSIGDHCPLAYFDHQRRLVELDLNELRLGFAGLKEGILTEIGTLPVLTRLHIARALQRPLGEQVIIWQDFATTFLKSDDEKRIYLQAQITTHKSEKQIWQSIRETTPKSPVVFDTDAFFGDMDQTQLRLWLTQNRSDFRFPYGWLRLDRESEPDDQLFALGINWFLSKYTELKNLSGVSLAIFSRLISLSRYFDSDRDFSEFAIDSFVQGDIFRYVPPLNERLVVDFLESLLNRYLQFDRAQTLLEILKSSHLSVDTTAILLDAALRDEGMSQSTRQQLRKLLRQSAHIQNLRQDLDFNELVLSILHELSTAED